MKAQDVIAEGVLATKPGLARYLAGFDESNRTKQAPNLPNHAVWNLGHLALTMHRVCGLLQPGRSLPTSDFIDGGTKSGGGDAARFATESVSFGSIPLDDPKGYPTLARAVEIYNAACDALAAAIRATPDAELGRTLEWGATMQIPAYLLVIRMVSHNGMHIGQLADLRRALGFKSIFA